MLALTGEFTHMTEADENGMVASWKSVAAETDTTEAILISYYWMLSVRRDGEVSRYSIE